MQGGNNAREDVPSVTAEKLIADAKGALANDTEFQKLAKLGAASEAPVTTSAPLANAHSADAAEVTPAPAQHTESAADGGHGDWLTKEPEALALAKQQGKPVIIDFGAEWCAACKELERDTFPAPEVAAVLKDFVKLRIDCTEASDETDALQKKYGSTSLPTVAFVGKDGVWKKDLTLFSFEKPEKFLERLKKVQ